MNKRKILFSLLLTAVLIFIISFSCFASENKDYTVYVNEESGRAAVLLDQAELLTNEQEEKVLERMKTVTPYATAIFVTNDQSHSGNVVDYARSVLEDICSETSQDGYNAVIFMIDMYSRELTVYVGETTGKVITQALTDTVTDNVYEYASDKNYEACADKAFEQIYRVLDGQRIAQPMRFITAALLAIFVGLAAALILVRTKTKRKEAASSEIMSALLTREIVPEINTRVTDVKKVPHVEVHVSGGGGGFHGGGGGGFHGGGGGGFHGGGGGGGGFSGGGHGGSHRF